VSASVNIVHDIHIDGHRGNLQSHTNRSGFAWLDHEPHLAAGRLYERGALSHQDDLKKVGINLKLAVVDTATNSDRQRKSDFQASTAPASVHMDEPDLYYARFPCDAPSNHGKYCDVAPGREIGRVLWERASSSARIRVA
jgi:hypothetical protein